MDVQYMEKNLEKNQNPVIPMVNRTMLDFGNYMMTSTYRILQK